jgi:cytochrome c oxidase subunit 2
MVDHLSYFLILVAAFFGLLIFFLLGLFAWKYRRPPGTPPRAAPLPSEQTVRRMEILWFSVPFVISLVIFVWGASIFIEMQKAPADALKFYVIGKQWMWKIEHPEGKGEIDELHVPVNVPVRLILTSQDVIHSFYVPDFRVKADALPGRYTTLWFKATRVGTYPLFCAEYCGTDHSRMRGRVIVMKEADYENWVRDRTAASSLTEQGRKIYETRGCAVCHESNQAPSLRGLFGREVALENGGTATADENYLRRSVLIPSAQVVAGFPNIMPAFQGQLTEEEILSLIEYLKSLSLSGRSTR